MQEVRVQCHANAVVVTCELLDPVMSYTRVGGAAVQGQAGPGSMPRQCSCRDRTFARSGYVGEGRGNMQLSKVKKHFFNVLFVVSHRTFENNKELVCKEDYFLLIMRLSTLL